MSLTITELTAISQYNNANLTTYSTPSLTAAANKLYVLFTWSINHVSMFYEAE